MIDAQARIFFDVNEPIDTPPIFNTLDADAPHSAVDPLPAVTEPLRFDVAWSGEDAMLDEADRFVRTVDVVDPDAEVAGV